MKKFTCSYRFDGGEWGFDIYAKDSAEAKSRLDQIKAWGKIDGEVMAEIPAGFGGGWLIRFACWLRNALA